MAIRVFNFVSNGMGGIDWSGLPYAIALYGVVDVEGLLLRLNIMKCHHPDKPAGSSDE